MSSDSLLSIEDLEIRFPTSSGEISVVQDVSIDIRPGEFFGLIGETGAGKSPVGTFSRRTRRRCGTSAETSWRSSCRTLARR